MRTLFQINTIANSGSTGRIAEEIGLSVMSRGWRSIVAYGRGTMPSQSELFRIGNDWDIKLHGLKTRLGDRHGLGSVRATKLLVKKIQEVSPDIIHLHNLHGYYLNYPILFDFLSKSNIPVVWTLHDCWAMTGHCVHFSYIHCERWKTQCMACPQYRQYPASLCWDRSEQNYKEKRSFFTSVKNITLVPVSNWLNNLLKESFLKDCLHRRIYNGIDVDLFNRINTVNSVKDKYHIRRDKILLLGVASQWIARKGLYDFSTLSNYLSDKYVIVLVGLTQKQISRLPNGILGIQRTENKAELIELYSVADIFLNLTWEDNFPTTNLEAMACGTPVITYETGGSVEAVSVETGCIVKQGDIGGVVGAIHILLQGDCERRSQACRQRVVELYNKVDRYNEYISLYEEMISKSIEY